MGNRKQITKYGYLKSVLIIFFLSLAFRALAPDIHVAFVFVSEPIDQHNNSEPEGLYDRLINAVIQVESLGDTMAYNLIEEATGAFQIRPIRLLDYNRKTGSNYQLEDCYNFKVSKEIFLYYAQRIGIEDYESIARKWNGSGKATLEYWDKVKSLL
ncbi:MAG: hypothetical protein JW830_01310 [Bacteroidales bacterium]|nr:hypothetical protein [Bacteroidales bacterium]